MADSKPRTITIDNIHQFDHCTECGGDVLAGIATLYKAPGNSSWLVVDVLCQVCSDSMTLAMQQTRADVQAAYEQAAASRLN